MATKKESEIINQIRAQILQGYNQENILEFVEKEYRIKKPLLLFQKALMEFAKVHETKDSIKRGFAITAVGMLYRKMLESGDYPGALSAMKEFNKLNNLYVDIERKKPKFKKTKEGEDFSDFFSGEE